MIRFEMNQFFGNFSLKYQFLQAFIRSDIKILSFSKNEITELIIEKLIYRCLDFFNINAKIKNLTNKLFMNFHSMNSIQDYFRDP
jgi:hypothetical protein